MSHIDAETVAIIVTRGIAGQITARADYDCEPTFVGSAYGGPIVMVCSPGTQFFVTEPERFGSFDADPEAWVRAFYS